ncbi:hypothetical protein E2C01_076291 [Portunus trituberculatus]|uniref:Uncharacterized protein n=1 Tax=Portunus trituberculatus TaxID=210409 RepID=A0A5B7IHC0_PORTR|nr:hypothetical protein [Portunus trituberculatus]
MVVGVDVWDGLGTRSGGFCGYGYGVWGRISSRVEGNRCDRGSDGGGGGGGDGDGGIETCYLIQVSMFWLWF